MIQHISKGYIDENLLYELFSNKYIRKDSGDDSDEMDIVEVLRYDANNEGMNNLLRLGIARIENGFIERSCKIMERLYFISTRPVINTGINKFVKNGELEFESLMKHVMINTDYSKLNEKYSKFLWCRQTRSKSDKQLYPSERNYQYLWFSYLYTICSNSNYIPYFEHGIGLSPNSDRVDLVIKFEHLNTIKIYQVEVVANAGLSENDKHSIPYHYSRQVTNYHPVLEGTVKSLVISVENVSTSRSNWWPERKSSDIIMIYFIHIWDKIRKAFKEPYFVEQS